MRTLIRIIRIYNYAAVVCIITRTRMSVAVRDVWIDITRNKFSVFILVEKRIMSYFFFCREYYSALMNKRWKITPMLYSGSLRTKMGVIFSTVGQSRRFEFCTFFNGANYELNFKAQRKAFERKLVRTTSNIRILEICEVFRKERKIVKIQILEIFQRNFKILLKRENNPI